MENKQTLWFLKNEGHKLLEEYVALDNYLGENSTRRRAYVKLSTKLVKHHKAHFGMMTTEEEIIHAIERLRHMIKKRKSKITHLGWDKNIVAPNVRELQRQASELNKELVA